jgi:hypothetical protein
LWSILSFIKQFSFGTCIYNCRPSWYEAINCDYFVDSKLNNGCDKARKLHMDILKTMYNQNDYSIEKWKLHYLGTVNFINKYIWIYLKIWHVSSKEIQHSYRNYLLQVSYCLSSKNWNKCRPRYIMPRKFHY